MKQKEVAANDAQKKTAKPQRRQRNTPTQTVEQKSVQPEAQRAKKAKTPLVLGIILALLLVVGAGFFLWYFCCYSRPERVALDMTNDLLQSKHVVLDGTVLLTPKADVDSELQQVELDFDVASSAAPSASNVNLKFVFKNGQNFSLQLGTVVLQDGVIYLRVGGIMEALEAAGINAELPDEGQVVVDLLETIDGEWWQISVPDLVDEFYFADEDVTQLKATYDCAVRALGNDHSAELEKLYREHSFINLVKVKTLEFDTENNYVGATAEEGTAFYRVDLDYTALTDFLNALPESDAAKQVFACVEDNLPGSQVDISDIDELSVGEVQEAFADKIRVYVEISNWCHQLKKVVAQLIDEDTVMNLHMNIYRQEATISSPESYRPITDLGDEIMEMVSDLLVMQSYQGETIYVEEF